MGSNYIGDPSWCTTRPSSKAVGLGHTWKALDNSTRFPWCPLFWPSEMLFSPFSRTWVLQSYPLLQKLFPKKQRNKHSHTVSVLGAGGQSKTIDRCVLGELRLGLENSVWWNTPVEDFVRNATSIYTGDVSTSQVRRLTLAAISIHCNLISSAIN